jgi:toxin ParE1/3/4
MVEFRVSPAAGLRIDAIYDYGRKRWGEEQAKAYIHGLFAHFSAIVEHRIIWRPIPAELEVSGYYARYERHYVYWRILSDGSVGIVTVLHERMHQIARFRDDAE